MKLETMICPVCGSNELLNYNDRLKCRYCETILAKQGLESEEETRKIASLIYAESDLKLSPPRFEDALDKFSALIKQYPDWSVPRWGYLRAKYGIKYVVEAKKVTPVCYNSSYYDIREDKQYKAAVELAESEELKNKYISEAWRIADTYKRWIEKTNNIDYDVFISFKSTDNGQSTEDKSVMMTLYHYLTEHGFKVFFAPITMVDFVGVPVYDAYIFNALEKSEVLIVYGSKPEYFTSPWVESEWMRFLLQIERKEKPENSLIAIYDSFSPAELPHRLEKRQLYDGSSKLMMPDILKLVRSIFDEIKKSNHIEHVDIKKAKPGKKKAGDNTSGIILEDFGKTTKKKKGEASKKKYDVKSFTSHHKDSSPTAEDFLNLASLSLRDNHFDEAKDFYKNCIELSPSKGYIGLLCSELYDYKLLLDFDPEIEFKTRLVDDYEISLLANHVDLLSKIIENTDDIKVGERALTVIGTTLLVSALETCKRFKSTNELIEKIIEIAYSYDYSTFDVVNSFVSKNLDQMFKILKKESFNNVCSTISGRLENDDLKKFLEDIIDKYEKNNDFENAIYWNNIAVELFSGEYNFVIRLIYYRTGVKSGRDLYQKHYKEYIADIVSDEVIKNIPSMEKDDANKIFNLLVSLEKELLKNVKSDIIAKNIRTYFYTLIKYNFEGRQEFIDFHVNYLSALVDYSMLDVIKDVVKYNSNNDPDYTISLLAKIGDSYRSKERYEEAISVFNDIFEVQENNFKGLEGIFLCKLNFSSSKASNIEWDKFNEKEFASILSYAEQKKDANDLIIYLLDKVVKEINEGKRLYKLFNTLIKYADESEYVRRFNDMGLVLLSKGKFKDAVDCADKSLSVQESNNIDARYILLMAKLKCTNEKEFISSRDFDKSLPEYKNLLFACQKDSKRLSEIVALADKNVNRR